MEVAVAITLGVAVLYVLWLLSSRFRNRLEDAGLPSRIFPGGMLGPRVAARGQANIVTGELRRLDARSCEISGPTQHGELRARTFRRMTSTRVDDGISVGDWVWVEHRGRTLLGLTKDDPRSAR